jgi:ketosteroid isomerase-like protein
MQEIERYYGLLAGKGDFTHLLSESFTISGCLEGSGKNAHCANTFFPLVKKFEVKKIISEGENACALVDYELGTPNGEKYSCACAEVFEIKGGKIASLAIYFDTAAYQKFMIPILFPTTRLKKKK